MSKEKKWKELKVGCLTETAYEFKDVNDNVFIGAYTNNGQMSGVCQLEEAYENGEKIYKTTNTFRMKVTHFREI